MPMDRSKYVQHWKAISAAVRQDAGNRCEFCGVENYVIGARDIHGKWHSENAIHNMGSSEGMALFNEFPKMIRIVLTVAHLDHDTRNNDRSNLRALCQKCHLTYDAQYHAQNARKTRAEKKADAITQTGQLSIFSE